MESEDEKSRVMTGWAESPDVMALDSVIRPRLGPDLAVVLDWMRHMSGLVGRVHFSQISGKNPKQEEKIPDHPEKKPQWVKSKTQRAWRPGEGFALICTNPGTPTDFHLISTENTKIPRESCS